MTLYDLTVLSSNSYENQYWYVWLSAHKYFRKFVLQELLEHYEGATAMIDDLHGQLAESKLENENLLAQIKVCFQEFLELIKHKSVFYPWKIRDLYFMKHKCLPNL